MFRFSIPLTLLLILLAGCDSRGRAAPFITVSDGDSSVTDDRCWEPSSIVPDITCGAAIPGAVCPGSCGQTLEGTVGVGLSSCRCMDGGSGFGAQWICDTSMCDVGGSDAGVGPDGAVPRDGGTTETDTGTPRTDAGTECGPATVDPPSAPGCTRAQGDAFRRITSQVEYDAFAGDPANAACNSCLSTYVLSCATARGCDDEAGEMTCCLDARCDRDDRPCRQSALDGACGEAAASMTRCVEGVASCRLTPEAPPSECFP